MVVAVAVTGAPDDLVPAEAHAAMAKTEAKANTLRKELTGNFMAGNFIVVNPPRARGIRKLPRVSSPGHLIVKE
jgi:hypothetical protein